MDDVYKQKNNKKFKLDFSSTDINCEKWVENNNENNFSSSNTQQMFQNLIHNNDGEQNSFEPDLVGFFDFDDLDPHLHNLPVNLQPLSDVNTDFKNERPLLNQSYLELTTENKQHKNSNTLSELLSFESISKNVNNMFNATKHIEDINQIKFKNNQPITNNNYISVTEPEYGANISQQTYHLPQTRNLYSPYSTNHNNHSISTVFYNNQSAHTDIPVINHVEKTFKIEASSFITSEQDAYNIPNEIFALYLESLPNNATTSEQCRTLINNNNLKHKVSGKKDEEIVTPAKKIKENSRTQRKSQPSSPTMIGSQSSSPIPLSPLASSPKKLSPQQQTNKILYFNEKAEENISAVKIEPARRYNLKNGFERLQQLLPNLNDGKSGKISKAAMLQKAAEYIHSVQTSQLELKQELDNYNLEIDSLSNEISNLQNNLPENGVSMLASNVNRTDSIRQKFDAFVKERSTKNWKFYIFSTILKPLFDNYIENVNIASNEQLESLLIEWQTCHFNLNKLRPLVSGALRQLSKSTSILSDPSKLPAEISVKIQTNQ